MYLPPQFREDRIEAQYDLIRQNPLGLLVTAGAGGLMANPIPFIIGEAGAGRGSLRCHMARANPQTRELCGVEECLVIFQGPQAYVTPSWYPSKRETEKVVPTWNYVTVHVWGRPKVIDEEAWLREQINELTDLQERRRASPWSMADAPQDFIAAQLKAIIGVEIQISRIEGKWKVSQNRPEADRAGVAEGLLKEGEAQLGQLVRARIQSKPDLQS